MYIFQEIDNVYALASPHTDGQLITDVVKKMKIGVITGSTNRNPVGALKEIINKINSGNNVVITPNGPRGPIYKINSRIHTRNIFPACDDTNSLKFNMVYYTFSHSIFYCCNTSNSFFIPSFFSSSSSSFIFSFM